MGKYHVYGIGNALVDMEFQISPELLQQLGIDKGVMTLIDEDRHHALVQELSSFSGKKASGGSAANTIVAVSQFGGKAFYSCKVGNDETGAFYLEDLRRCGVDIIDSERDHGITGKCIVMITPDADRTMNTFLGITGNFSEKELLPEAIINSEYLYMEGYLVTSETGRAAAVKAREMAKKAGAKSALSLSDPNMAEFFKPGLLEMIGDGIDLIFANESEALKMAQTQDFSEAIAYLKTLSKAVAITRGAEGSLIYDGENTHEIAPFKVKAVDTVGAGDMYAGAFLYALTHGMSYPEAGTLASKASAKIVSTFGPRLETPEIEALLNS